MYLLGFVEALMGAFGSNGNLAQVFPAGYWCQYGYATVLLFVCLIVVGIGAKFFAARYVFVLGFLFVCLSTICCSSFLIFIILMTAIASVFGSLLFGGGGDAAHSVYHYTGLSSCQTTHSIHSQSMHQVLQ